MNPADAGPSWKLYAKIGLAFAVALALLVPLPSIVLDPETDHVWFAVFGLSIGSLTLYGGWARYKEAQLVRNTPTSKVRSLAVGAAEVKGQAEPVEEPLVSPLTHTPACMYRLRVEEYQRDDDDSDWETVLTLSEQIPFSVDDGTGRVRVEPEDASLEIEVEKKVQVDDGHEPPAEVGEWAVEQGMVTRADEPEPEGITDRLADAVDAMSASRAERPLVRTSSRDRRYTERVLAAGESAYVFGGARRRDGADDVENERNLVIREHAGTETFIVSDKTERGLLDDVLLGSAILLAVALVFLPYGVLSALAWLGIV